MLEILFIFGVMGWLSGLAWEFLSGLAAFPTILAAFAAVPLIASADYLSTIHHLELAGLDESRVPVPPERFYWTLHRSQLLRTLGWSGPLAILAWWIALDFPADLALDSRSLLGWTSGALAIFATARFVARAIVYVRASHWFDRMAPWAVGVCRRTMYRLSDNPDFLDPANPKRRETEKTIY